MTEPVQEPVNAAEEDPSVPPDADVGTSTAHGVPSATEGRVDAAAPDEEDGDAEAQVGLGPAD